MCADRQDPRARAVLRDKALRLFATHGPETVSLRVLAQSAGVSPGLVTHHFGSEAGLREAVDAHVHRVFDELFAAMDHTGWGDQRTAGLLAEMFVSALPPDSPIPTYVRRLLLSGDPAGQRVIQRWYRSSRAVLDRWEATGVVRPTDDPAARAAFLMMNDVAVLLLREHLTALLGADPLDSAGMTRWAGQVMSVYRNGLFAGSREESAHPDPSSPTDLADHASGDRHRPVQ
ncbi:MAG: TetR family transcriptional regulator [Actinocatenispora sp.]